MKAKIAAPMLAAWALALCACGERQQEPARTQAPAATPATFDFAAWVGANADCNGDYVADVQQADFGRRLREAGVSVSADSLIGEVGVGGGTLTPGRPIRLHGLPVRRIDYDFGSGATFAVVVDASAEQARAAIGAAPLPEIYREYYRLGVATAPPSEDVPMPDIRFVRPGEQQGTQELGCAAFDM
ncbi:hypothetical protein [Lysobacter sp. CA199]|uniref:hypothetical protein n=1 Tax=Lysobacter sp. CA199 TaxID=3455608 RepID=UPI003F8CFE93